MSNASDAFEPLISHWNALRRPSASRVASIVPTAPFSNVDRGLDRVVDLAAGEERLDERRHRRDLADEGPRQVDDVRAEVAERARARLVGVEAPGVERRVVAPVLEVAAAEVPDLAELARLDHLAREPDRRDEAVVERAEVLDAGRRDALPDLVALVGRHDRAASRR